MGMSIDEKIHCLKSGVIEGYDCTKCPYVNKSGCDFNGSIQWALGVIKRYQKIQEIINNTDYIEEDVIRYKMICEVIEDGNVD